MKIIFNKFTSNKWLLVCFFWVFFLTQNGFAQLSITDQSPAPNSTTAASSQTITITFNRNVNASSLNGNIFVDGSVSGSISGNISLASPNVAEFTPSQAFSEGEKISVTVTDDVEASNGASLNNPNTWLFYVEPFVGSFDYSSPQIYTLRQGSEPSGIKAVDLSNNRAPDLVVVNSNNSLITILENTTQTSDDFEIVSEIETGIDSGGDLLEQEVQAQASTLPVNSSITSADLNNNGNTDVIIAATLANQLIILRNPSADPSDLQLEFIDTGDRPVQVISGDFDGNGAIDLAVAAIGSDQIYVHYNNGNGSFNNTQVENVGLAPSSIAAEDINGDGFLDIAIAVSGENRVEGLINQGNGNFDLNTLVDDLSFTPSFLITGNFQQDSGNEFADFIIGSTDEEIFYVFENSGGNFSFVGSWNSGSSSRPLFAVPGDLDSNGTLDLISTHFNSDDLAVNEFAPSGAFGNRTIIDGNTPGPLGITAADLNLGGSMDIAITNSTNNQVSIYFNNFDTEVCENLVGGLSFPGEVNFGAVELNTTATRDFQISNNSSVSFDVTLEIVDGDNFELVSPSDFTLSIGSQRTVTVNFTPDQVDQYSDELLVRVTSVCGTETFTIDLIGEVGEPLPDLEATDLNSTSFETEYFLGTPYSFEGVFELNGDVEVSDDFDVEFLVNEIIQSTDRETRTIQPGQSFAYPFNITFTEIGSTTLTFFVDSREEIEEIDETNNEISITINVVEGDMKVSPNPFTPNNDGFNDQVRFDFSQLANINNPEIKIFSFNGRLVRTFNPDDFSGGLIPWNGTDESGNKLQPGVYLYVVQNNNQLILKGSVTLAL
jgi:gliding motility-associated-like protein